jgi:hypothetical protein
MGYLGVTGRPRRVVTRSRTTSRRNRPRLLPSASAPSPEHSDDERLETAAVIFPGDFVSVELTLATRITDTNCTAPNSVGRENPPVVDAFGHFDGGSFDGHEHDRHRQFPALANGKNSRTRSRQLTARTFGEFHRSRRENIPRTRPIRARTPSRRTPFDACGGSAQNILGAFIQPVNAWPDGAPGTEQSRRRPHAPRLPHRWEIYETDSSGSRGAQISTVFGGVGSATRFRPAHQRRVRPNPNGVPQVIAWNDPDSAIN